MAANHATSLVVDFDNIPEQALIPEDEQPYPIPNHWKWVRLGAVVSTSNQKIEIFTGSEKYLGLEHLKKGGGIAGYGDTSAIKSAKAVFLPGQLLYGKLRPYLDKHAIVEFQGVCSTDILVYQESALVNLNWLEAWMSSSFFIEQANAASKGINLPRVSDKFLATTPFPLPPLDEQQTIVNQLQATNRQLDNILERLDQFLGQVPKQRTAIIQAGVSGVLTRQWREEKGISWPINISSGLFEFVTSGSRGWSKYYSDEGAAFLRMGNLTRDGIDLDLTELQRVLLPSKAEGKRSQLVNGDLLVSITADVGHVALVGNIEGEAYINQHLALARPASHVLPEYLAWYLRSPVGIRTVRMRQRGATKTGLGLDDIRTLSLPLPDHIEQIEIVRRLNIEFTRLDQSVLLVADAQTQILEVKKTTLARALRGLR